MNRRARLSGRQWVIASIAASVLLSAAPLATAQSEQGRFPTNLALLDRLTAEAVEEVLDGLNLPDGEPIIVVADGYNEGNDFVASAFAKALARRGLAVRMLTESAPPPAEKTETPSSPTGGTAVPPPDSPAARVQDMVERGQDPFAPDSTEVDADSLSWADADSLDSDDSTTDGQGDAESQDDRPSWLPDPDEEGADSTDAAAPAPAPATTRAYPEGPVLEFKVLEFGVSYPTVDRPFLLLGRSSVHRLAGVYVQGSHLLGPEGTIKEVASGQSHWQDRLGGNSRSLAEGASYPFRAPEVPPSRLGRYVEPVVVVGIIGSLVYLFYQNQN